MNETGFKIKQVKWQDMKSHLCHIRTVVFIEEQNVPENMEWDSYDDTCVHVIAEMNEEYIATGRLLDSGQIGRMAVLKPYRKLGVGSALLERLLSIAESRKMKSVFLNAQIDAVDFYKKFGFKEEGDAFDDAGILHKKMNKAFC
ncbi:MAG: GNAT family N-acetyltransferase [Proteobacteria bacterium]|nr:GNAT family N-acetyltransferase [Pseudomonadota bacterium]NOG59296.1 GNAT family N-acetyltransferase [Pseudomonadota bacterium]